MLSKDVAQASSPPRRPPRVSAKQGQRAGPGFSPGPRQVRQTGSPNVARQGAGLHYRVDYSGVDGRHDL